MQYQERKRPRHAFWVIPANIVFAGTGHILTGHLAKGLIISAAYLLFLDGILLGSQISPRDLAVYIRITSITLAAVVWLYSNISLVYLAFFTDYQKLEIETAKRYLSGVADYIKGDYRLAREEFEDILIADMGKTPARLFAGSAAALIGDRKSAARAYRNARKLDRTGEWAFEIDEAIDRFDALSGRTI